MSKPSIEEIKHAVKEAVESCDELYYCVFAVRTQEQPFELGELSHVSSVWDDGEETDEEMDGVCATLADSRAIKMHSSEYDIFDGHYFGDHCAVIAGNVYSYGMDDGEVIISDPVVVKVIR